MLQCSPSPSSPSLFSSASTMRRVTSASRCGEDSSLIRFVGGLWTMRQRGCLASQRDASEEAQLASQNRSEESPRYWTELCTTAKSVSEKFKRAASPGSVRASPSGSNYSSLNGCSVIQSRRYVATPDSDLESLSPSRPSDLHHGDSGHFPSRPHVRLIREHRELLRGFARLCPDLDLDWKHLGTFKPYA